MAVECGELLIMSCDTARVLFKVRVRVSVWIIAVFSLPCSGLSRFHVPSLKDTTIVRWCGQYHSKSQQHDRKCTATHTSTIRPLGGENTAVNVSGKWVAILAPLSPIAASHRCKQSMSQTTKHCCSYTEVDAGMFQNK